MADRPSHLRVAGDDEQPPEPPEVKKPKNITEALEFSSRDVLAAMRKALAKKLDKDEVSSNSIASAYKELRELDRLIRMLEAAEKDEDDDGTPADEAFDAAVI